MNKLIDYKQMLSAIRNKSLVLLQNAGKDKEAELLQIQTDEIFAKRNPSIMFYGLYNAGKSSIINAIFGNDIAPVGDVPTTYQVQRIAWEHFTIVDTPGINAKNEHTLVADSEIALHDMILFVIDDMNIEEKSFYSAFVRVLKSGKPVLIVINEKNAGEESLNDSPKLRKLKERMIENIRMEGRNQGVPDIEYCRNFHNIIAVNAMTAYDAKQLTGQDAEILYQDSNLGELILVMQNILRASDGVRTLLPAISILKQSLTETEAAMKSTIQSDVLNQYMQTVNTLKKQQNQLYQRLISEGKQQIMLFGDKLAASAEGNASVSRTEIQEVLHQIIRRGFEEANLVLEQQYELYAVNHTIGFEINKEDFRVRIPEIAPLQEESFLEHFSPIVYMSETVDPADLMEKAAARVQESGSGLMKVIEGTSAVAGGTAATVKGATTVAEGVAVAAEGVAATARGIAAGTAVTTGTAAATAGSIVAGVGTAVSGIASTVLNPVVAVPILISVLAKRKRKMEEQRRQIEEQQRMIEENNHMIEQRVNEMIAQIMDVNRQIRTELYKLEDSYTNCVARLVEEAFSGLFSQMEALYHEQHQEKENAEAWIAEIHQLLEQLIKLECELEEVN